MILREDPVVVDVEAMVEKDWTEAEEPMDE